MDINALANVQNIVVGVLIAIIPAIMKYYTGKIKNYREQQVALEKEKAQKELDMVAHVEELMSNYCELQQSFDKYSNEFKVLSKKVNHVCNAGLVILTDRLLQSMRHFIEVGKTTMIARQNIDALYKSYCAYVTDGDTDKSIHRLYEIYSRIPVHDDGNFFGTVMNGKLMTEDNAVVKSRYDITPHYDTDI